MTDDGKNLLFPSSVVRYPSSYMNGWLILDKPTGMTSAQAVNRVKKLVAQWLSDSVAKSPRHPATKSPSFKIGHAGTLDPLASGILPLALGEATKTINYMMDAAKSYAFTVSWGEKRDTDDREGKVIASSDKRPTYEEIKAILPRFIGEIEQMPPQFSALKVDGERAYDLAREGKVAELKARKVRVDSLLLRPPLEGGQGFPLETQGGYEKKSIATPPEFPIGNSALPQGEGGRAPRDDTTFLCHCGKGTYIRAIARDLGDILGCYGHVSMLRRLSVGKFSEKDAISLENLEEMVHNGRLSLLPVESALDDILALDITPPQATLLKRGQAVQVTHSPQSIVLARCNGLAIALCEVSEGTMKPVRVFNIG